MKILLAFVLTACAFAQTRTTDLAVAIAKAEGANIKTGPHGGSIPYRCNNAGDIRAMRGVTLPGQVGVCAGKYIKFKTREAGMAALRHELDIISAGRSTRYNAGMSLAQMGRIWAGDSRWADIVAKTLGVSTKTQLWTLLDPPAEDPSTGSTTNSSHRSGSTSTYRTNRTADGAKISFDKVGAD